MSTLEKRLIALQQQLESLNAEVTGLIALTSASQPVSSDSDQLTSDKSLPNRPLTDVSTSPVGLTRFRQLAEASV